MFSLCFILFQAKDFGKYIQKLMEQKQLILGIITLLSLFFEQRRHGNFFFSQSSWDEKMNMIFFFFLFIEQNGDVVSGSCGTLYFTSLEIQKTSKIFTLPFFVSSFMNACYRNSMCDSFDLGHVVNWCNICYMYLQNVLIIYMRLFYLSFQFVQY